MAVNWRTTCSTGENPSGPSDARPKRLASLTNRGAEAAVGDAADPAFLTSAFRGATAVFALIPPNYAAPNFRAFYNQIGNSIAKAIQDSGVKDVVFLSSIGAELPDKTGVIKGLHDVEQKLNQIDGVNVLHLRPTYFMENLFSNIGLIKNMGITGGDLKPDVSFAMIATQDIATVAADKLTARGFTGKTALELLGERDLSMNDVTRVLGSKIGKPDLNYVQFSQEDARKGMMDFGMSANVADELLELGEAINTGLIAVGVSRDGENTTGTSIEEFAEKFAQAYAHA